MVTEVVAVGAERFLRGKQLQGATKRSADKSSCTSAAPVVSGRVHEAQALSCDAYLYPELRKDSRTYSCSRSQGYKVDESKEEMYLDGRR